MKAFIKGITALPWNLPRQPSAAFNSSNMATASPHVLQLKAASLCRRSCACTATMVLPTSLAIKKPSRGESHLLRKLEQAVLFMCRVGQGCQGHSQQFVGAARRIHHIPVHHF